MLWNRANQLVPGSPTAVTFDTKLGRGERVVVLCVGVRECVFPSITSRPRRQSGIYLFFFVGTRNMLPSSAPTEQPKSLEETIFFFFCGNNWFLLCCGFSADDGADLPGESVVCSLARRGFFLNGLFNPSGHPRVWGPFFSGEIAGSRRKWAPIGRITRCLSFP